jgi:hypothetical protein
MNEPIVRCRHCGGEIYAMELGMPINDCGCTRRRDATPISTRERVVDGRVYRRDVDSIEDP